MLIKPNGDISQEQRSDRSRKSRESREQPPQPPNSMQGISRNYAVICSKRLCTSDESIGIKLASLILRLSVPLMKPERFSAFPRLEGLIWERHAQPKSCYLQMQNSPETRSCTSLPRAQSDLPRRGVIPMCSMALLFLDNVVVSSSRTGVLRRNHYPLALCGTNPSSGSSPAFNISQGKSQTLILCRLKLRTGSNIPVHGEKTRRWCALARDCGRLWHLGEVELCSFFPDCWA